MSKMYQPKFEWRFLGPDFWPIWLVVGFLGLLTLTPGIVRQRLAKWLGRQVLIRHRKRRQIVETNLAMCFPEKSDKARQVMVRRYFEYMAMSLLDYGLLWFGRPWQLNRRIVIQGVENVENPYLSDRRIIILTCHTTGLEFGAIALTRRYPTVGLVKAGRNPLFDWLISRGRTRFNSKVIERSAGIRHVVNAIRKKNIFYYLPDEDLGRVTRTEFLPFFGIQTATLTTLGRMADMTHAVVVPCITHFNRKKDRYEVKCLPALQNFPSGDDVTDAQTMNQVLEQMIREAPEQYMWSFRLFQTRPEGESSPYER